MSQKRRDSDEQVKPTSDSGAVKTEVFCRYIRRKDGKIVYPKNAKAFHFFVVKV